MGQLSRRFAPHAETIATILFGKPTSHSRSELRFGRKGSLAVYIAGLRAGRFRDYEQSAGGDLVDLVRRELNMSAPEALRWLADMTGALPSLLRAAVQKPATVAAGIVPLRAV